MNQLSEKRFTVESTMVRECILDNKTGEQLDTFDYTERLCELLNEQQEQLDLYKEAILTMLGLLADKGIILSGVKDE